MFSCKCCSMHHHHWYYISQSTPQAYSQSTSHHQMMYSILAWSVLRLPTMQQLQLVLCTTMQVLHTLVLQGCYTLRSVSDPVYPVILIKVLLCLGCFARSTLKLSKYKICRTYGQNIGHYRTTFKNIGFMDEWDDCSILLNTLEWTCRDNSSV